MGALNNSLYVMFCDALNLNNAPLVCISMPSSKGNIIAWQRKRIWPIVVA
jgi:hypothetical protein